MDGVCLLKWSKPRKSIQYGSFKVKPQSCFCAQSSTKTRMVVHFERNILYKVIIFWSYFILISVSKPSLFQYMSIVKSENKPGWLLRCQTRSWLKAVYLKGGKKIWYEKALMLLSLIPQCRCHGFTHGSCLWFYRTFTMDIFRTFSSLPAAEEAFRFDTLYRSSFPGRVLKEANFYCDWFYVSAKVGRLEYVSKQTTNSWRIESDSMTWITNCLIQLTNLCHILREFIQRNTV